MILYPQTNSWNIKKIKKLNKTKALAFFKKI